MIYTAPCIMFWMRANPLQGEVGGGWALELPSFLGPVKWHRADRRVPFGAQVMDMHASKTLCTGHRCFMHTSPLVTLTGCILGRSRAHTVGGGGAGELKELNHPAWAAQVN